MKNIARIATLASLIVVWVLLDSAARFAYSSLVPGIPDCGELPIAAVPRVFVTYYDWSSEMLLVRLLASASFLMPALLGFGFARDSAARVGAGLIGFVQLAFAAWSLHALEYRDYGYNFTSGVVTIFFLIICGGIAGYLSQRMRSGTRPATMPKIGMLPIALIMVSMTTLARGDDASASKRTSRTTMPIGKSWNLTAEKHERTKTEGERTKLLTSTGRPVLKHGANVIKGPWDIEASAGKIECDFVAKKFVLSGSPNLKRLDPKTGAIFRTIAGDEASKIEVSFDAATISPFGNVTTTALDGPRK